MVTDETADTTRTALLPALVAMTALQALVALAMFAPGVLAPQMALGAGELSLYAVIVFGTGAVTAVWGGVLADRFGSMRIAALVACAVMAGMAAVALLPPPAMLVIAGLMIGLAFGPETPASSALLARLTPPAKQPLVFSVRQTGNQAGAMLGSLALPALGLAVSPAAGFTAIAIVAALALVVFLGLRRRYDHGPAGAHVRPLSLAASLLMLRADARLARLALASLPYSAMQMALNTYFVLFAVKHLDLGVAGAGALLALAQGAGLAGRVGFGILVMRGVPAISLIALIGTGMASAAALVAVAGPLLPPLVLTVVVALFGLTASGWNGVFLAEVARLAPPGRVGEATGAVLMASYTGLVLGPIAVGGIAAAAGLRASFLVLAVAAAAGATIVFRVRS
jgi:MFS family permease